MRRISVDWRHLNRIEGHDYNMVNGQIVPLSTLRKDDIVLIRVFDQGILVRVFKVCLSERVSSGQPLDLFDHHIETQLFRSVE